MAYSSKTDIDMTLVYLVGIFGGLFIYITVIAVQVYYYHADQTAINERVLTTKNYELEQYKIEELKLLHSYGWVNPETKTVRIPIEEAIQLTTKEFQTGTFPDYETLIPDPAAGAAQN